MTGTRAAGDTKDVAEVIAARHPPTAPGDRTPGKGHAGTDKDARVVNIAVTQTSVCAV